MLWGPILEPIFRQQNITDTRVILILNGLIIATYPLFQFLAIQPLNSLAEKYGKKKILLITQLGTCISLSIGIIAISLPALRELSILGVSSGIWLLIISRMIDGISGGNAMVNNNYATDIITQENMDSTEAFSYVELSMIAGSLTGVFLGPIFGRTRFGTVGAIYLILSVAIIGMYVIWTQVKDLNVNRNKVVAFHQDLNIMHQLRQIKGHKVIQRTLFYRFIFQVIFISFISNIFIFLKNIMGIEGPEISIVMFFVAIITISCIMIINPIILKKYGGKGTFEVAKIYLMLGLAMFLIFPYLGNGIIVGVLLLLSYLVLSIGVTNSLSLFKYFLTDSIDDAKRGKVLALEEQVLIIAGVIGPILTGFITAGFDQWRLPPQTLFLYFLFLGVLYLTLDRIYFADKK
jgi:MFS transporter, DHA1 family, tetracycline resistance protein